jgi:uncharacterized protein DUF6538
LWLAAAAFWVKTLGGLGQVLGQKLSRYLVKVQSTYHYRRFVPADVRPLVGNRQWWKQSLKTGELRLAEVRARALAVEHDRVIDSIREKGPRERLAALQAEERSIVDVAKRDAVRMATENPRIWRTYARCFAGIIELPPVDR